MATVIPKWADSMEHIFGLQRKGRGNSGTARVDGADCLPGFQQFGAGLFMDDRTPNPITGRGFAVFTMASTAMLAISFRTITKGIWRPPFYHF